MVSATQKIELIVVFMCNSLLGERVTMTQLKVILCLLNTIYESFMEVAHCLLGKIHYKENVR